VRYNLDESASGPDLWGRKGVRLAYARTGTTHPSPAAGLPGSAWHFGRAGAELRHPDTVAFDPFERGPIREPGNHCEPPGRLGAAVLVDGPTKVIDHLALEVAVDGTSYLVDAGFGADAPIEPLPLAQKGPIGTRSGSFEFLDSPQGTTLAALKDGVPHALYRFKRVNHSMADFAATSQRLQADPELHWSTKPFATRLVDDDGTRITLTRGRLRTTRPGSRVDDQAIAPTEWQRVLHDRFGISEQVPPQALEGAPD